MLGLGFGCCFGISGIIFACLWNLRLGCFVLAACLVICLTWICSLRASVSILFYVGRIVVGFVLIAGCMLCCGLYS